MPLHNSCEKYKGQAVFVMPVEGSGWSKRLPETPRLQPGERIETPHQFHARLIEFHYLLGQIRAGIAVIDQTNHPLDKQWLAFCIRDGMGYSTHNLSDNPAQHNISIGNVKPTITIDPENLAMPEWMRFGDAAYLTGLGYITESEISLDEIFNRLKKL